MALIHFDSFFFFSLHSSFHVCYMFFVSFLCAIFLFDTICLYSSYKLYFDSMFSFSLHSSSISLSIERPNEEKQNIKNSISNIYIVLSNCLSVISAFENNRLLLCDIHENEKQTICKNAFFRSVKITIRQFVYIFYFPLSLCSLATFIHIDLYIYNLCQLLASTNLNHFEHHIFCTHTQTLIKTHVQKLRLICL